MGREGPRLFISIAMETGHAAVIPAARKDINKLKRKRSKSVSNPSEKRSRTSTNTSTTTLAATMDLEAILAELEGPCEPQDPSTNQTQVHYYTYMPQQQYGYQTTPQQPVSYKTQEPQQGHEASAESLKHGSARKLQLEPKLLLRQMYRLYNHTDVVVGLESSCGYNATIYLVSSQASVNFTIEDLLSVRSISVLGVLDEYFNNSSAQPFQSFYFNTVLIKAGHNKTVSICNYQVRASPLQRQVLDRDVLCQTTSLMLYASGWNALKRSFDCIESYFRICQECSPIVQHLITRYCQYFTKHYKTAVLLSAATNKNDNGTLKVPLEIERHITKDLPLFLADFDESRLPYSGGWDFQTSQLQVSLTPWIDSEVRKFCSSTICEAVFQDIKYDIVRW